MLLFFDTETDGVSAQKRLVQLAAIVTEEDGTLRNSCNFIVKPDGYEISEEASRIHGINTEIALKRGIPLAVAISVLNNFLLTCSGGYLIAHNIQFDIGVIENCYKIGGWPSRLNLLRRFCTMEATKNRLKLPPTAKQRAAGFTDYKAPKLSEAYQFAFKKPLENAHDALYDVMACKDIYFWLKNIEGSREKPSITQECTIDSLLGIPISDTETSLPS